MNTSGPPVSDRHRSTEKSTDNLSSTPVTIRAVVRGFSGGLIATAVVTPYRSPVFRALPPTAEFWARYVGGGEPEEYLLQGILLHFPYGGIAGGLFGPVFGAIDARTTLDRDRLGLATGLCYGILRSVFGTRILFGFVLRRELDPEEALVFHVGHVVYGLTLGTWIGSGERFGAVYD